MSLLSIIVALVVVGVILWVINNYIPMSPSVKKILNIVVIIFLIVWLLRAFGVWTSLGRLRV